MLLESSPLLSFVQLLLSRIHLQTKSTQCSPVLNERQPRYVHGEPRLPPNIFLNNFLPVLRYKYFSKTWVLRTTIFSTTIFIESSSFARHFPKVTSCRPYHSPANQVIIIWFYIWGGWDPEKLLRIPDWLEIKARNRRNVGEEVGRWAGMLLQTLIFPKGRRKYRRESQS